MLEKLKSFAADDAFFYGVLLLLVAVSSFGLGQQSVAEKPLNQDQNSTVLKAVQTPPPTAASPTPISTLKTDSESTETPATGEVVASKSGSKYHLPTCSGAKSIKPENLVTFESIEAAEAAGYTPAANCKFE